MFLIQQTKSKSVSMFELQLPHCFFEEKTVRTFMNIDYLFCQVYFCMNKLIRTLWFVENDELYLNLINEVDHQGGLLGETVSFGGITLTRVTISKVLFQGKIDMKNK